MPKQAPIEISPRRPNPNVLFTDRERERELLQRIMSPTVTPEETPELFLTVLYGVGGSGKSALATKARQAAGEYATVRVVSVDFDSDVWKADSSYLAVAGALAKAFARDGVQVPLLEFLLALHNVQGAISAKADVRGWALFKSVVAKAASPIPAAGPIADLLVKLGEWVFDHARTTQLVSEIIDFGLWPVERSGCIDLQDLESRLAQALFVDLRNLLDREREMHVRVLFDGFDRIQGNQLRPDAQHHIQRLLGYCAVSLDRDVFDRLRVVIFSRESLKWDTLYGDSEWSRHWSQHLVSGFAEADAREYIGRWRTWFDDTGKEEVAVALRREEGRILDVSLESAIGHRAYSPFSLTLAVTEIDTACASGRSDFELHSASGDIRMSLLRHLDWAERRALMTLAIVGTFDSNLFDWLAENQLISFPVGSFASSVHQERCYFEATAPDSWRFNRLFSEALLAEWTTSEADAVMERLLGYWVAKLETPERDWTEPDIATWCTGFEILLSRGLERKLLSHERFQELAAQSPWNSWNFRLLSARLGFLQRIVAFEEANLGADHLDTLASIQNLAVLLGKRGSYADAEALLRRALSGFRRALPLDHPETLTAMRNLAGLLSGIGKESEADELIDELAEIASRPSQDDGPGDLSGLLTLQTVAAHQMHRKNYTLAAQLFSHAARGFLEFCGPDDRKTLHSFKGLADALAAANDPDAGVLYKELLEKYEELLGPDHLDTLALLNNLANLSIRNNQMGVGLEAALDRVVRGYEAVLGPDNPETLLAKNNLALVWRSDKKPEKAETMHREVLGLRINLFGWEHSDTLLSAHNLAAVLADRKKYQEAEELLQRVVTGRRKLLGPSDPDTLNSMMALATLTIPRDPKSALKALLDLQDEFQQRYGYNHRMTAAIRNNIEIAEQLIRAL